jgi:TatD DNase family protein
MDDYGDGREQMIERNLQEGVFMIAVGASLNSSQEAIALAEKYENKIWATVGCHPDEIGDNFNFEEFENLADSKVIAIGEVGLDYFRTPEIEKRMKQGEIFRQFADLAKNKNLPLVLHVRNEKADLSPACAGMAQAGKSAHDDMAKLLSGGMRGVAHSFTGTIDEAKKYLNLGFYLGFNGIITFANQYDEIVKYTPIEQILLETDAPWLSPVPYRGQKNEPMRVMEVAMRVAELKNVEMEELIDICNQNAKKLFSIDF